ncbi:MAG: hypothetical protein HKO02_02000 [Hyphomonadaceae bacterium]|nr:hypothetical protein [Hyphomonadaceae bacterium]
MVTPGNENETENADDTDIIGVETIAFPFEMSAPQFEAESAPADIGDIDGTVLHLNSLVPDQDNTVVLKGFAEELVHLVTDNTMLESGVFDGNTALPSADLMGFHYYLFPDDIKIYSDQALVIL